MTGAGGDKPKKCCVILMSGDWESFAEKNEHLTLMKS
jgi:hypothetical protein